MAYLHMRADITLKMRDGETREESEDRLIDLIETLKDAGVLLVGWIGDTEVVDDDDA